jgi:hypothetical protein
MAQYPIGRVIAGVHSHQQAGIAALFQHFGIARPGMMYAPMRLVMNMTSDSRNTHMPSFMLYTSTPGIGRCVSIDPLPV